LLRAIIGPRCRSAAKTWLIFLLSLHLGPLSFKRQVLNRNPLTRSLRFVLSEPRKTAKHACPPRLNVRSALTIQPVPRPPYAYEASCRLRKAAVEASSQIATDSIGRLLTWRQRTNNSDNQSRFRGTVSIHQAGRVSNSRGPYYRRARERALRPFDCVQCLDRQHLRRHGLFRARSVLAHIARG